MIAQLHWGDENSQRPNASQIAVAKKLTDAKVITVVVGQGPHVVQPIERINGKFVVFSEGNLVSNQGAATGLPAATQDGLDRAAALQGRRRASHRPPGHLRADLGPPSATTWSYRRRPRRTPPRCERSARSHASASSAGATASARSTEPAGWRGAFAAVCVIGSAIAVWLVVVDSDAGDGKRDRSERVQAPAEDARRRCPRSRRPQVHGLGERRPAHAPAAARPGARQRRRHELRLRPVLQADRPLRRGVDLGLCHMETPMGPVPAGTYRSSTLRPPRRFRRRAAGTPAAPPRTTRVDGGQAGIDGTVEASPRGLDHTGSFRARPSSRKPTIINVDGVKIGFVAYTDATNGIPVPHPWSVNEYPADDPEAARRRSSPTRRRRGRRGRSRDRPDPLGRRELPGPTVPRWPWPRSSPSRSGHRRRRPGPARGAADRAHQRQVRRLQRGQPRVQSEHRERPARRDPGRAVALLHFKAEGRRGEGAAGSPTCRPGSAPATTPCCRRSRAPIRRTPGR